MTPRVQLTLSLVVCVVPIIAAIAQPVAEGGRKFDTALSGANEVNAAHPTGGAGDPDGTGTAHVVVNVGQQRVCWDITVTNLGTVTRGHIHHAPALQNGAIVIPFFEAGNVNLQSCTPESQLIDRRLLMDIIQHPQDYYVNVHTADFPAGAVRGQLSK
jgi:hypothetical protein